MQTKQISRILIAGIAIICLASCSPTSKKAYLDQYDEFVSGVSANYKTYDEDTWTKQTARYEKFSGEWYDKFKDELTLKEQLTVKALQVKWLYYRNLEEATSAIKQLFDAVDIKGMKQKIQYYIDNEMRADLQKFYDEAKHASDEARTAVDEILEELNVKIDELRCDDTRE